MVSAVQNMIDYPPLAEQSETGGMERLYRFGFGRRITFKQAEAVFIKAIATSRQSTALVLFRKYSRGMEC